MTNSTLANPIPATAAEGWEDVEALVRATVWRFMGQYGGDFDELFGQAQVAFMQGDARYREGQGTGGERWAHPYHTEIRRWVWFELFDRMRTEAERGERCRVSAEGEAVYNRTDGDWHRCRRLAAEVSDDAAVVLGLVFDPPEALAATIRGRGGEGRNYRSCIREHLRTNECWSAARINNAFEEIREEL